MDTLFFEDLRPGEVSQFGGRSVSRDEIVAFAREFDPQPFHLDEEAARGTFVGRLIASGWHTCALQMAMLCDGWILRSSSMGGPGVEEVKWLKPVLPGDTLSVRQTILDSKPSRSRPEMGLVQILMETLTGADEVVMTQQMWVMFGRREPAQSLSVSDQRKPARGVGAATATAQAEAPKPGSARPQDFDEVEIGHTERMGSHLLTADEIVRFARQFDFQPFHVDEQAARASHFGGLVASGWHTAALWMRSLVDHRVLLRREAEASGRRSPVFGPSPGFKNLQWLQPVRAGDTLHFATTVLDKRPSASRPGWGLIFSRNTAENQHGETVFAFDGSVFWARRTG